MPQFTGSPALQARVGTFDYPAIQEQANRRQLQEAQLQKMQAEAQRLQSGQLTPSEQLDRDRYDLDVGKDERTQESEYTSAMAQYARASVGKSPMEQQAIYSAALRLAGEKGKSTANWKKPGDPDYEAWLGAVAAAGEEAGKAPERFEVVKNPYGLGGVGQRETTTGKISGYQKAADAGKGDQRERIIQDTMKLWGVDRKTAQGIKDDIIVVGTDPFGNQFLYNKIEKTTTPLTGTGPALPPITAPTQSGDETEERLGFDPSEAVGISGAVAQPYGWLMETFFGADVVPEAREGKIALDALRRNAVTIGSTDVPGRPSDFARRLEDDLTIKAGNIFESDIHARRKLEKAENRIGTEIKRMDGLLKRRDIMPRQRSAIVGNRSQMQRFKDELSLLLSAWGQPGGGKGDMAVGDTTTFEGVTVKRVE